MRLARICSRSRLLTGVGQSRNGGRRMWTSGARPQSRRWSRACWLAFPSRMGRRAWTGRSSSSWPECWSAHSSTWTAASGSERIRTSSRRTHWLPVARIRRSASRRRWRGCAQSHTRRRAASTGTSRPTRRSAAGAVLAESRRPRLWSRPWQRLERRGTRRSSTVGSCSCCAVVIATASGGQVRPQSTCSTRSRR
jgi:hypothetical protein